MSLHISSAGGLNDKNWIRICKSWWHFRLKRLSHAEPDISLKSDEQQQRLQSGVVNESQLQTQCAVALEDMPVQEKLFHWKSVHHTINVKSFLHVFFLENLSVPLLFGGRRWDPMVEVWSLHPTRFWCLSGFYFVFVDTTLLPEWPVSSASIEIHVTLFSHSMHD